jgi:hypothetical protein
VAEFPLALLRVVPPAEADRHVEPAVTQKIATDIKGTVVSLAVEHRRSFYAIVFVAISTRAVR